MTTTKNCPLCDQEAAYTVVNQPPGKRFSCGICGSFFIDGPSELHIAELPEIFKTEYRVELQKKAKACADNGLLVIREPRADETGYNERNKVIAECVSRPPPP